MAHVAWREQPTDQASQTQTPGCDLGSLVIENRGSRIEDGRLIADSRTSNGRRVGTNERSPRKTAMRWDDGAGRG
jgi:hypothetical protein